MTRREPLLCRRAVLASLGAMALPLPFAVPVTAGEALHRRPIPASGEQIPVIGMGSSRTFNAGASPGLRKSRTEVLQAFFEMGGGMIDSSPMYGSSEAVIGHGLSTLGEQRGLFSATKVWTRSQSDGVEQMAESRQLWGLPRFDLMQIHNLVSWERHLETLLEDKAAARARYIGITTSHGRRHGDMEEIMASQPIDFAQFTYNILDREAEQRLLPLAAEKGIAVIVNRPFQLKGLFRKFGDEPLPSWAAEIDCANWAQVFLKFIVSHPAVTCAIPATSRVDHMRENMGALRGRLPDAALRKRMVATIEDL